MSILYKIWSLRNKAFSLFACILEPQFVFPGPCLLRARGGDDEPWAPAGVQAGGGAGRGESKGKERKERLFLKKYFVSSLPYNVASLSFLHLRVGFKYVNS